MTDAEPGLDLDALLDPARLAAAWQVARERSATHDDGVGEAVGEAGGETADDLAPPFTPEATDADALAFALADEATDPGEPARAAPLPIALAYSRFLAEIEHTLAAAPAIADKARRALAVPLAQLARAIDPVDLTAAEVALDQLEDLWQALLTDAGWPQIPHCDED